MSRTLQQSTLEEVSSPLDVCELCHSRPAHGVGEHVLPQWFLRRFFPGGGTTPDTTYITEVDGVAVTRRDGSVRTHTDITRLFLAVCEQCNAAMSQSYEQGAIRPVTELFDGGRVRDPDDLANVCRWLAKTAVLLGHPATSDRELSRARRQLPVPDQALIDWIIGPVGSPLPPWTSIWVARTGRQPLPDAGAPAPEQAAIDLPSFTSSGKLYLPSSNLLILGGTSDLVLVDVVYHPGCEVVHPFDGHAGSAKLHPETPNSFSLADLVPLSVVEASAWRSSWGWVHPVDLEPNFDPLVTPWRLPGDRSDDNLFMARGVAGGRGPTVALNGYSPPPPELRFTGPQE